MELGGAPEESDGCAGDEGFRTGGQLVPGHHRATVDKERTLHWYVKFKGGTLPKILYTKIAQTVCSSTDGSVSPAPSP